MNPTRIELLGTVLFALAILHTFSVKVFQHLACKYREGSVLENLFHLLGEIEIVFGVWAAILVATVAFVIDPSTAIKLVEKRNFTEPLFVFAIMTVAATRPVVSLARQAIAMASKLFPFGRESAFLFSALTVGPLLGSFITEPAAMTVTALIMRDRFFDKARSERLKYMMLGTLFVNVSIGGVLTHFAAPPVLMVARTWKWDTAFMLRHFGWKTALACIANAGILILLNKKELAKNVAPSSLHRGRLPWWLNVLHLAFLALIVLTSHHPAVFIGLLLLFLGLADITKEHQEELKLKESLLVAFFLAGLVVLGGLQGWWLKPLVASLSERALFLGATGLTAFTDNAALTYLGSLIPNVSSSFQYALVAGAVAGGGLTVIANAPNPAGFAILRERFGTEGISPVRLFFSALLPTAIAMMFLWILP
ncbi:putative Na+/H+ antiporter [bacterium]|nr:putative Na+/H+ antiporter [bacterium]